MNQQHWCKDYNHHWDCECGDCSWDYEYPCKKHQPIFINKNVIPRDGWHKPELEKIAPIKLGQLVLCKHHAHYNEYAMVIAITNERDGYFSYKLRNNFGRSAGDFGSFGHDEIEVANKSNLRMPLSHIKIKYF